MHTEFLSTANLNNPQVAKVGKAALAAKALDMSVASGQVVWQLPNVQFKAGGWGTARTSSVWDHMLPTSLHPFFALLSTCTPKRL